MQKLPIVIKVIGPDRS